MKKSIILAFTVVLAMSLLFAAAAFAHTPICSCYDNGDGTVTCEGGFSDGSSAAGVKMEVRDMDENVLVSGEMNASSEFVFDMPEMDYVVLFDAGPGHLITINGEDIW